MDLWKRASKRMCVEARSSGSDGAVKVTGLDANEKKAEDSDEDELTAIWGCRLPGQKEKASGSKKPKSPKSAKKARKGAGKGAGDDLAIEIEEDDDEDEVEEDQDGEDGENPDEASGEHQPQPRTRKSKKGLIHKSPKKRKITRVASDPQAPRGIKAKKGKAGSSGDKLPKPSPGPSPKKLAHELDVAEQVLLQLQQAKSKVKADATFMSLTIKQMDQVLA